MKTVLITIMLIISINLFSQKFEILQSEQLTEYNYEIMHLDDELTIAKPMGDNQYLFVINSLDEILYQFNRKPTDNETLYNISSTRFLLIGSPEVINSSGNFFVEVDNQNNSVKILK